MLSFLPGAGPLPFPLHDQPTMKTITTAVGALIVFPLAALAQPGVQKAQPPQPLPAYTPPQPLPPYESLVKRGPDGRVIRITGCLEALALKQNPLVTPEMMEQIKPAVKEWTADINQLVIDNVDLLERLDAGLLDHAESSDIAKARIVQTIIGQLNSAGQLSQRLMQERVIELRPAQLIMQMSNEYIQAVAQDLVRPQANEGSAADQQARQTAQAQSVNHWYQSLSMRDAREQYRRILVDSAPMLDQILPTLGLAGDAQTKVQAKAAAVKSASTDVDKLVAVRSLLDDLSFDQRRAYLAKAVGLGAAADPFHPAPNFPDKAQETTATPAGSTPAAAATKPASPTK